MGTGEVNCLYTEAYMGGNPKNWNNGYKKHHPLHVMANYQLEN